MNRSVIETMGSNMKPIPEKCANTPNLYRLACEPAKFKDPYRACGVLLGLAGPMLKQGKEREDPA